jgi:DNA primase
MNSTSEIKKLAESYDELILKSLGFQFISERGVQQNCPVHNGDNNAAFSYDRSKNCWSCFTHQCHKKYGNDIIGLVRSIKNMTFSEAVEWIGNVINSPEINCGYIPKEKRDNVKLNNSVISESNIKKLKALDNIPNKKFKTDTINHFNCGIVNDKNVMPQHHRVMIPLRNEEGQLIGFSGRSIYKKCSETGFFIPSWLNKSSPYIKMYSKWRHYPKGLNKSIELYNSHEAKHWIERVGFAVLVEGPYDLWRMWEFGVKNCVASYGCSVSNAQISSLIKFGAKCVGVLFDSDKAGEEGYNKAKILHQSKIDVVKLMLPKDKDPAELTEDEYKNQIKPQLSVLRKRYENKDNYLDGQSAER